MEKITLFEVLPVGQDTFAIPAYCPMPGLGLLPMNAFLIRGACPTLIDAGPVPLQGEFVQRLQSVIDPGDLEFLWLTHMDPDHTGAVDALLAAAPRARLVTTFLGAGKLGLRGPISPEKFVLLNSGERLDLGDRELLALRPPTYDAPETIAAFDPSTRTLFAADAFGAPMDTPLDSAADIASARLRERLALWTSIDCPWLADFDQARFGEALTRIRRLEPDTILSSHLPPARGMTEALLAHLSAAAEACFSAVVTEEDNAMVP